jgi:hypothetical protein
MLDTDRSRNYCFTLNNYTPEQETHLEKLKCKYIIYGKEQGASGTPHLQGFVIWNHGKSFRATKKMLPQGAHIELCKGTPYDNFEYCSKDGDFVERGTRPERVGQGKRNDMILIKKNVAENVKLKTMLEKDIIVNYQQLKYAEGLAKYYERTRNWKPQVLWYYGPTGTGKTKTAYEEARSAYEDDDIYFAMDTAQWFDGYDAQKVVIIDDMRKDFIKFHLLLKLLDRYPYRVQTKGSTRQFLAERIVITAPYRPEEMYDNREDIHQLLRRIDTVKEFN